MNKKIGRVLALVMAVTLLGTVLASNVSATVATFTPPSKSMTVDKNLITMAAHSQAWITPEVLGITNTTSRNTELDENFYNGKTIVKNVPQDDYNKSSAITALGVFGSDINDNPNPYLYNYFYNCVQTKNAGATTPLGTYTLCYSIGGSPMAAATTPVVKLGNVCSSLYLRPDILLGVDDVTKDENGKILTTGYTAYINALPENKDTDKTNDYVPSEVVYTNLHVYSFLNSMYTLSDICKEITATTGKTTRYDDPYVITTDMEKYVKGLQSYVISKIRADKKDLPVVAVINYSVTNNLRDAGLIAKDEFVLDTKKASLESTTTFSRAAEFVADVSTNIADKLGLDEVQKPKVFTKGYSETEYNALPEKDQGKTKKEYTAVTDKDTKKVTGYKLNVDQNKVITEAEYNELSDYDKSECTRSQISGSTYYASVVSKNASTYVISADQMAQYADVVIFGDVLSSVPENNGNSGTAGEVIKELDKTEHAEEAKDIEYMDCAFDCVGSIGANSVENLFGMAYYTAYLYPQYVNQFDVATYWYRNFYHISDTTKLKDIIDKNFGNTDVMSDYKSVYTTDITKYNESALEDKIIEGMKYYEANEASFKDTLLYENGRTSEKTGWDIDWTVGIGADSKATVNVTTPSDTKKVTATVSDASKKTITDTIVSNFTPEELEAYNFGADLDIDVALTPVDEKDLSAEVVKEIKAAVAKGETIGAYLNIDISYTLGNNDAVKVTDLGNDEIEITVSLPTELQGKGTYVIYREHDGKVDAIVPTVSADGKSLTFKSSKFSTYAIAYTEKIADTADNTAIVSVVAATAVSALGAAYIMVAKKKSELD